MLLGLCVPGIQPLRRIIPSARFAVAPAFLRVEKSVESGEYMTPIMPRGSGG